MAQKDKRRSDLRVPVNSESFFASSAVIDVADAGAGDLVLMSFPKAGDRYLLLHAGVEVIEAFDGGASLVFGQGTMPTDALGVVTPVDADYLLPSADITEAAAAYYPAASSQLVTDLAAGTSHIVVGAAATVPVFYGTLAGAPTVGKARLHLVLMKIPTAG